MLKYENEYKGRKYVTYAICCHCGHTEKLSEFKHLLIDGPEVNGLITCPNSECSAVDDPGVWLDFRRVYE